MQYLGMTLLCCLAAFAGLSGAANRNAEQSSEERQGAIEEKQGASKDKQAKEKQRASDARRQVLKLEQDWVTAEDKRDEAALRRILDDKFLASFGPNQPYDKETFIKQELSGSVDPTESQTLSDQRVILDRDTAVVIGTGTERGTRNGAAYEEVYRYTVTYIRRNGRWLALAEHLVEVPKGKGQR